MDNNISYPQFYQGQLISHHDLNNLSSSIFEQYKKLNQTIYPEGGIIALGEQSLKVEIDTSLGIIIHPGIILLETGIPVSISNRILFDLAGFTNKEVRTLVISIEAEEEKIDYLTDDIHSNLGGYTRKKINPRIVVSHDQPAKNTTEIARVYLSERSKKIRSMTSPEEWYESSKIKAQLADSSYAVLDLRFRKELIPVTATISDREKLIELRKNLYEIENLISAIKDRFPLGKDYTFSSPLANLHAEFLSTPIQLGKVSFWLAEFAEALSKFLNQIHMVYHGNRTDLGLQNILDIIGDLEVFRQKCITYKSMNLPDVVSRLSGRLQEIVTHADQKFSLKEILTSEINLNISRFIPFNDTIVLGGRSFAKLDTITATDTGRVKVDEKFIVKVQTASFQSGEKLSLQGTHIKSGSYKFEFDILDPKLDALIIFHEYLRRNLSKISIEVNGNEVRRLTEKVNSMSNNWINSAIYIPNEYLVANANKLKILVQEPDLEFGLYDIAIYQPTL